MSYTPDNCFRTFGTLPGHHLACASISPSGHVGSAKKNKKNCHNFFFRSCRTPPPFHLDNTLWSRQVVFLGLKQLAFVGSILLDSALQKLVKKIPPTTISKIYREYGQKSSSKPIVCVYFDNRGSLDHSTCSLCALGSFTNRTEQILHVNLFTGQLCERGGVRSDRGGPTIGQKWFSR